MDFEKLAEQHELPQEVRSVVQKMMRRRTGNGLSEDQLRERLDRAQGASNLTGGQRPQFGRIGPAVPCLSAILEKPSPAPLRWVL